MKWTPGLKAALWFAPFIVGLELLSSLLPGVGYVLGFPISIIVYFFQGALAVWFLYQNTDSTAPRSLPKALGQGIVSAFWSGVVLSTLITIISLLFEIPVTAGTALLGLPAVLAASILDVALNLIFSVLGAWVYFATGKAGMYKGSCILFGIGTSGIIFVILGLWAVLTGGALGFFIHHILPGH